MKFSEVDLELISMTERYIQKICKVLISTVICDSSFKEMSNIGHAQRWVLTNLLLIQSMLNLLLFQKAEKLSTRFHMSTHFIIRYKCDYIETKNFLSKEVHSGVGPNYKK